MFLIFFYKNWCDSLLRIIWDDKQVEKNNEKCSSILEIDESFIRIFLDFFEMRISTLFLEFN